MGSLASTNNISAYAETVARTPEDNIFLNHIGDGCGSQLYYVTVHVPLSCWPFGTSRFWFAFSDKSHLCEGQQQIGLAPLHGKAGVHTPASEAAPQANQGTMQQKIPCTWCPEAPVWGHREITQGQTWGRGLVTLVGDAAHPTTPALGQGGCMALEVGIPRPFAES